VTSAPKDQSGTSKQQSDARPLRVAIVGCGRMGRLHCERLQADGRSQVVALLDAERTAALALRKAAAIDAAIAERFTDIIEPGRIDATPIEAAIVCSPTQLHFEQAAALLKRGIHVLCEKPLARTRSEILELIRAADQSEAILSVAYQRRCWATYRAMRRILRSKELGAVRAVVSHNTENWQQTIGGTWRDDPELNPGGFIGDAGSHKIDAVFFVTGLAPVEVFARSDRSGSRVETTASVSAGLEGGASLTMDFVGNAQRFSEMLAVYCERGDLILRDGAIWIARGSAAERLVNDAGTAAADPSPVDAFLDTLLAGAENFAPPECALPVLEFTQAILESAQSGQPVRLPASARPA